MTKRVVLIGHPVAHSLSGAMQQAGIVQGMELDIHSAMVSFDIEQPGAHGTVTGMRLLGSMNSPSERSCLAMPKGMAG